ncbi:hypothetical protein KC19_1G177800 [Ceratodon purpureus]|uniref:Uncharacterized protein n=1 Tax=Ceratodon purpureus TaxID=3225 RepID=A0A8T0J9P8_CERPU|nr:hypothetical protein KC19_1G177800 [Ceratodon purpureus]
MAISREAIVFVVVSCIVATVAGFGEDGLPRPTNFPDTPTTWFGPEPLIMTPDGKFVDCSWYGFANEQYDASVGEKCLDDLWAGLTNATADVTLEPFVYYFSAGPTGSDPATLEPYCYEGCFNMDTGALAPDSGLFPPSVAPAPGPDCYIRGPTLAPNYWPGTPPSAVAPAPTSGA